MSSLSPVATPKTIPTFPWLHKKCSRKEWCCSLRLRRSLHVVGACIDLNYVVHDWICDIMTGICGTGGLRGIECWLFDCFIPQVLFDIGNSTAQAEKRPLHSSCDTGRQDFVSRLGTQND